MLTIVVSIFLNYLNLFCFRDYSNGTKEGTKVKHWRITYIFSWIIPLIPIIGLIFEAWWTIENVDFHKYKCTSYWFNKV